MGAKEEISLPELFLKDSHIVLCMTPSSCLSQRRFSKTASLALQNPDDIQLLKYSINLPSWCWFRGKFLERKICRDSQTPLWSYNMIETTQFGLFAGDLNNNIMFPHQLQLNCFTLSICIERVGIISNL